MTYQRKCFNSILYDKLKCTHILSKCDGLRNLITFEVDEIWLSNLLGTLKVKL